MSSKESTSDSDEELLFKCRKCPGKVFTAAEKDAHRQWYNIIKRQSNDGADLQPYCCTQNITRHVKSKGVGKSAETGSYNAIIFNPEKKIVGRTHVTDLSRISGKSWKVMYKDKILSNDTKLQDLPLGPKNPLKIYQLKVSGPKAATIAKAADTNKSTKKPKSRRRSASIKFEFGGRGVPRWRRKMSPPEDDEVSESSDDSDSECVFGSYRRRDLRYLSGGDGSYPSHMRRRGKAMAAKVSKPRTCHLKDLEGRRTTDCGDWLPQNAEETWMAFAPGFNVEGKCQNSKCISRKSKKLPILRCGYGNSCLRGNLLICPACDSRTLKPGNVLVSSARSSMNFRKSERRIGSSTLLEHLGEFPNYITPDEGNDNVDYDVVEITTVKPDEFPFICSWCDIAIGRKADEVMKPCDHCFHESCSHHACPICYCQNVDDLLN